VNLPNSLTLLRIFIVPLLVVVLLTPFSENWFGVPRHVVGVVIFLAAALTDYLDGHLARSRGQVTRLGQLLDPIADKLLISAALISLVENQLAPAWAVVIILGREFAVTGLRSIAAVEGVVISASKMGKFKMPRVSAESRRSQTSANRFRRSSSGLCRSCEWHGNTSSLADQRVATIGKYFFILRAGRCCGW
jgi:CDP-diacylglycerol--glycerol-3-phosphate 3-phosphatidyltransferase